MSSLIVCNWGHCQIFPKKNSRMMNDRLSQLIFVKHPISLLYHGRSIA